MMKKIPAKTIMAPSRITMTISMDSYTSKKEPILLSHLYSRPGWSPLSGVKVISLK